MASKNNHFENVINNSSFWLEKLYSPKREVSIYDAPGGAIATCKRHGRITAFGIAGYDADAVDEAAYEMNIRLTHIMCVDGWEGVEKELSLIA